MADYSDDRNGRVTMAILAAKLDALRDELHTWCQYHEAQAQRTDETLKDYDNRLREVEHEVVRLDVRGGVLAGINMALTAVGSTVAALLGRH